MDDARTVDSITLPCLRSVVLEDRVFRIGDYGRCAFLVKYRSTVPGTVADE